jgi:uncharacterized membrane protein YhiD involved in acid resistance
MQKSSDSTSWVPIRKVAIGFLAAAIVWVAQRIGLDFGPAAVNQAATAVVGFIVAYLVPLARKVPAVEEAVEAVEKVVDAVDALKTVDFVPAPPSEAVVVTEQPVDVRKPGPPSLPPDSPQF